MNAGLPSDHSNPTFPVPWEARFDAVSLEDFIASPSAWLKKQARARKEGSKKALVRLKKLTMSTLLAYSSENIEIVDTLELQ